ncbi:hypothetical protein DPMN_013782 [Dreissena polymorpha]|uniref:Uncharacterized protein n=1 Tax=Dreissena polymorpha TaxID=45954 RepID=A0A9D4N8I4_DREPO|nr:hypothetical protein DPMN_013782 [Dreissena polymorpha]
MIITKQYKRQQQNCQHQRRQQHNCQHHLRQQQNHQLFNNIITTTITTTNASTIFFPFQAQCKDRLFPFIHVFEKEYGASGEPRCAYILCFLIAVVMVCVGK